LGFFPDNKRGGMSMAGYRRDDLIAPASQECVRTDQRRAKTGVRASSGKSPSPDLIQGGKPVSGVRETRFGGRRNVRKVMPQENAEG
jgi:hypothetical protein